MPHIGHPAIRNRGTIGGSIAFADPAAELPACLLALGGEVEIAGPQGKRTRQGRRFLQGPVRDRAWRRGRADRDPHPRRQRQTRASASPSSRAATATMPWSGLAAMRAGRRQRTRAMCGWPISASAQRRLRAQKAESGARRAATSTRRCRRSRSDLDPPDDVQATGATKKHLAGVLLRRVAKQLDGGAVMSEPRCDITLTVNGETRRRDRRCAQDAGRFPARGAGR